MLENWIFWIVLGAIAGWIAGKLVGGSGGLIKNIIVGVLGSILGGWLFSQFGKAGVTGINWWSLLVAVVGSVVLLFLLKLITGSKK